MIRDYPLNGEIDDLMEKLRPLAIQAKTETAYWITVDGGEYPHDNGNEWCYDCGSKEVAKLKAENPDKDEDYYFLDGGWCSEHETPPMCAECGVKLEASLLTYAGIYELEHFADNPPTPGNVTHAYEVHEMLSAFICCGEQYEEPARQAIQIARTLVEQMEKGSA